MKNEILEYLNNFKDSDFHEINDFLKQKFGDERLFEMRGALTLLMDKKLIEVAASTHYRLSLPTPNIDQDKNVVADLNNWKMRAKILDEGRKRIADENYKIMQSKKAWYDTENAKRQYEDYPNVKRRAKTAIIIAIISLVATVVLGLLKIIYK